MATILIADPDPATWSLLELLVLRLGHRPISQRELAEGEQPDLMLLEPSSRLGLRQAQGLRRRLPQLPILCVSIADPNAETRDLGAVGHVMKPFHPTELEREIERALVPAAPALKSA
jgi:DNA-binding response OmpR family regulator